MVLLVGAASKFAEDTTTKIVRIRTPPPEPEPRKLRPSLKTRAPQENLGARPKTVRRLSLHEQRSMEEALELTDLDELVHPKDSEDNIDLDDYDDNIVAINLLNSRSKLAFARVDETCDKIQASKFKHQEPVSNHNMHHRERKCE